MRCPACGAATPAAVCPRCGGPAFAAADYGAARMLLADGATASAVSARLAELTPAARASLDARWAAQAGVIDRLTALADQLAGALLDPAAVQAELARELHRMTPIDPAALAGWTAFLDGIPPALDAAIAHASAAGPWPALQAAAATAGVRRGLLDGEPGVLGYLDGDGALVLEAAVALVGWRSPATWTRHDLPAWRQRVTRALDRPALAAAAAAALVYRGASVTEVTRAHLAAGMAQADREVRFACALALGDEAALADALVDGDPEMQRAAQRRLAAAGSARLAARLADGTDEDRRAVLTDLARAGELPAALVPALVTALAHGSPTVLERGLELVRRTPAATLPVDARLALAAVVEARARALPPRAAMDLMAWGLAEAATTAALARVGIAALDGDDARFEDVRFTDGWRALAGLALDDTDVAAAVRRWLTQATPAARVVNAWFDVHRARASAGASDDRLVRQVAWAWSLPARGAVVAALADATGRHGMASEYEPLLAWAWDRLCAHTGERADLYRAFHRWRDALLERRAATPRARRPGGASAADHLAVWGALDPERLGTTLDEAIRLVRPGDWRALVDACFALVDAAGEPRARVWPLVAACQLGHQLRNRVCDRDGDADAALDDAAAAWCARAAAEAARLRDEGLVIERDISNRVEDLESTVAMLAREFARRAEAAAEAERRRQAEAERAAQRAAAEAERAAQRAAAEAAAARLRDEHARQHAAAVAQRDALLARFAAPPPRSPTAPLEPQVPLEPLDTEPMFAHLPLPTLLDYVRATVRIQRGADVMALFAELGLDAASWAACAQAWSGRLGTHAALGQRFMTLLAAPWA
ncbi:MAG: hypothetical protein R3B06_03220 [Kofleriaceae bacterium]